MKCIHCGANIETDQKICPYCGTANPEAYKRERQLEEIQKKNEALTKQVLKDSGPQLLYKIHKRVNLALLVLLILVFAVSLGVYVAKESGEKHGGKKDIIRFYEEGAWEDLYLCMRSWDYFGEEGYHEYSYMALLWDSYRSCQLYFGEAYEEYLSTGYYSTWQLRRCVKEGYEVLTGYISPLYDKPSEQNLKNIQPYRDQIYILFTGMLQIPEEMLEDLDPKDGMGSNSLEEYVLEVLPNEE